MLPSPLKSKISKRTSASDESTSIVLGYDQMMILLKCDCPLNLAVCQKKINHPNPPGPPFTVLFHTPKNLDDLRLVFQSNFGALDRPKQFLCLPEELLHRLGLQMPSDFIDRNGLGVKFFWKAWHGMERYNFEKLDETQKKSRPKKLKWYLDFFGGF